MLHEPLIIERIEQAIEEGCNSQAAARGKRRRKITRGLPASLLNLFGRLTRKVHAADAFLADPKTLSR